MPDTRTCISAPDTQIYADVNNGVYKSGFSTTQPAYDEAQVSDHAQT